MESLFTLVVMLSRVRLFVTPWTGDLQVHTCIDKHYHRLYLLIAVLKTLFLFPRAHESLSRPLPFPY